MVRIVRNVWRPNTCGCAFERIVDTDIVPYEFTVTKVIERCPIHQNVSKEDFNNVIQLENDMAALRRGNIYLAVKDAGFQELIDKGELFSWSFSGEDYDRVCTLAIKADTLTSLQKIQLQNLANSEFGTGKVVII